MRWTIINLDKKLLSHLLLFEHNNLRKINCSDSSYFIHACEWIHIIQKYALYERCINNFTQPEYPVLCFYSIKWSGSLFDNVSGSLSMYCCSTKDQTVSDKMKIKVKRKRWKASLISSNNYPLYQNAIWFRKIHVDIRIFIWFDTT